VGDMHQPLQPRTTMTMAETASRWQWTASGTRSSPRRSAGRRPRWRSNCLP
jgi:hypothetical protein